MIGEVKLVAHQEIDTGHNYAGNGGNGTNFGEISNEPQFKLGDQPTVAMLDQSQHVWAGIGGNGGSHNEAEGGDVKLHDVVALKEIDTGHNYAGNGGNGTNYGEIENEPQVYATKWHGDQPSVAMVDQSQHVWAGIGGDGGSYNSAEGGDVSLGHTHEVMPI
jgi:hypothetical protein